MDTQKIIGNLERFKEDTEWLNKNYDRLKTRYPEEYVAVFNNRIVDHDRDLSRLMGRLEVRYPEKHGHIAIEFVTKKKVELILVVE